MTVVVKVVTVGSSVGGMLNKSQRLLLGLFVLLLVDVIWVSSSELTKVRKSLLLYCLYVMFAALVLNANYMIVYVSKKMFSTVPIDLYLLLLLSCWGVV